MQESAPEVDPPLHAHPASMLQFASHPSPGSLSPSSHSSEGCLNPFPHEETHSSLLVLGTLKEDHSRHVSGLLVVPPKQMYPLSITQLVHPSLSTSLPSSHASVGLSFFPFPQIVSHALLSVFGDWGSTH